MAGFLVLKSGYSLSIQQNIEDIIDIGHILFKEFWFGGGQFFIAGQTAGHGQTAQIIFFRAGNIIDTVADYPDILF